jgi:hypothetical protein
MTTTYYAHHEETPEETYADMMDARNKAENPVVEGEVHTVELPRPVYMAVDARPIGGVQTADALHHLIGLARGHRERGSRVILRKVSRERFATLQSAFAEREEHRAQAVGYTLESIAGVSSFQDYSRKLKAYHDVKLPRFVAFADDLTA